MTDLEKVETLLRELGIGYDKGQSYGQIYIELMEGNDKIKGNLHFHSDFLFSLDGTFLHMHITK